MGFASFGLESHSQEELVAEMGAALLCNQVGIAPLPVKNTVTYVHGWLDLLSKNKHMLAVAATHAQKAMEYLLGKG